MHLVHAARALNECRAIDLSHISRVSSYLLCDMTGGAMVDVRSCIEAIDVYSLIIARGMMSQLIIVHENYIKILAFTVSIKKHSEIF